MPQMISDDDARGGGRGKPMLIALVAGLVLSGAALAGFMFWSGSQSPRRGSPGRLALRDDRLRNGQGLRAGIIEHLRRAFGEPRLSGTGGPLH